MGVRRDKFDIIFSEIVRSRVADPPYCQHCKISSPEISAFDCAHIHGRRHKSGGLRWSFSNAVVLCRGCHRRFTDQPANFAKFLHGLLGEGYLDLLNEKLQNGQKLTKADKAELYEYLKKCREQVRQERLSGNDSFIELDDWI